MNYIVQKCLDTLKSNIIRQNQIQCLIRMISYKSAYSLEKLYPTSNLNLYTPNFVS
jgi:hypothetical protein